MQHANKKLICCLLAVEISDYEAKPIFDQVRLTQDFHSLFDATVRATSHDLVSIVEEDGALLAFLCDPELCLRTALAIRAATLTQDRYRELQLRIGIDLGNARIAGDELGHPHVTGEGRQDVDRLMRQGSPRQISVSRRFVELLLRSAPEMAELLEYGGLYSDNMGPLYWYRVPATQDTASKSLSDRPPEPALPSDIVDIPRQPELAPVPGSTQLMAKFQTGLQHPRLRYALLVLVVGAALVALWSRVSDAPSFKPAARMAVVTPQTIAPEPPKSLPGPAESVVGHAGSLLATVGSEETIGTAVTTPPELVKDPGKAPFAASPLFEPIEDAAMAAPRVELPAPGKVDSAAASERKQERSKRRSEKSVGEEPQLPAKGEATADAMLTCARIEMLTKRLECFDKLKRGGAGQTGSTGEGREARPTSPGS